MTILKNLNYAAMPDRSRMTPELHRRSKLIAKLNEQRALAEADQEGRLLTITHRRWVTAEGGRKHLTDVPKRLKRWWFNDNAGNCLFAVRYGSKVIELEKGLPAIIVGKTDNLVATIEMVISAVKAGELDAHLSAMGFGREVKGEVKPTP
jgi:hypothetical protein